MGIVNFEAIFGLQTGRSCLHKDPRKTKQNKTKHPNSPIKSVEVLKNQLSFPTRDLAGGKG